MLSAEAEATTQYMDFFNSLAYDNIAKANALTAIRMFIAIEIPAEIKMEISAIQDELKKTADASWTKPDSMHLTLKFLGHADSEKADSIERELKTAAQGIAPFRINVQGIGGFPNLNNPRVLWIGTDDSAELKLLAQRIEGGMASLGFEKEKRPFHPHLTLCRVRDRKQGEKLSKAINELKNSIKVDFTADSVVLFKSELERGGAVHTALKGINLNG